MQSGTHIGHCQACGRIQVVIPGEVLAKHGYNVRWGYFSGVCHGAGHTPLEVSREYLDDTVVALADYAARADKLVEEFKSGERVPGRVYKLSECGSIVYAEGAYHGRTWRDGPPIWIEWDAANALEQTQGLADAIETQEREASQARSHSESLLRLAARVHGQPLTVRSFEKPVKLEPPKVDVAAVIQTGACEVTFKTKAARKLALEEVSRQFEKLAQAIRNLHLAIPHDERTKAGDEVYFGIPHQANHWRAKHAAAILAVFPEAAPIVAEIEKVVAAREAIKAAP